MAREIDARVHYPPILDQWINQCRPRNAVRPLTPQKTGLVSLNKSALQDLLTNTGESRRVLGLPVTKG